MKKFKKSDLYTLGGFGIAVIGLIVGIFGEREKDNENKQDQSIEMRKMIKEEMNAKIDMRDLAVSLRFSTRLNSERRIKHEI